MTEWTGFTYPKENWSKLPHELIARFPDFTSQGEVLVVLYILRHTWGYQEFDEGKKITLDEFELGRKYRDGSRIDNGVGMSRTAILRGIEKAIKHGFIEIEEDNSDLARRKRWYKLCMNQEYRNATSEVSKRYPRGNEMTPRSEKETIERNEERELLQQAQKSEKPKPVAEDHLDLAFKTQQVQDKLKAPVKYLENIVLAVLGMKKVPNHKYGELWESPLRDLLDQADQDIDRVETALRAAALEGHGNKMTMTTASSLHGLALKALAQTNGKDTTEDIMAREAAARAKMHELAREHGHE